MQVTVLNCMGHDRWWKDLSRESFAMLQAAPLKIVILGAPVPLATKYEGSGLQSRQAFNPGGSGSLGDYGGSGLLGAGRIECLLACLCFQC